MRRIGAAHGMGKPTAASAPVVSDFGCDARTVVHARKVCRARAGYPAPTLHLPYTYPILLPTLYLPYTYSARLPAKKAAYPIPTRLKRVGRGGRYALHGFFSSFSKKHTMHHETPGYALFPT
jgi:hypothetical protein